MRCAVHQGKPASRLAHLLARAFSDCSPCDLISPLHHQIDHDLFEQKLLASYANLLEDPVPNVRLLALRTLAEHGACCACTADALLATDLTPACLPLPYAAEELVQHETLLPSILKLSGDHEADTDVKFQANMLLQPRPAAAGGGAGGAEGGERVTAASTAPASAPAPAAGNGGEGSGAAHS